MKHYYLLLFLLTPIFLVSQEPNEHPAYAGTFPKISNIQYDDYANQCKTTSFKVTWNAVHERFMSSYKIQVKKTNGSWETIKTIYKNGNSTYDTTINNLSAAWIVNNTYEIRIYIDVDPSYYVDGVRYTQGGSEIINWQNSVCNPPQEQKPNLRVKQLIIKKASDQSIVFNSNTGGTPILKNGNEYEFVVTIENNGNSTSVASTLEIHLTYDGNFPNSQFYGVNSLSFPSIPANSTSTQSEYNYVSKFIGSSPNLNNGSTYYLHFVSDTRDDNNELNENDNQYDLLFKYTSSVSKPPIEGEDPCTYCRNSSSNDYTLNEDEMKSGSRYLIKIFDISGVHIMQTHVNNVKAELEVIKKLPKKIYIIKSKHGSKKVFH